MLERFDAAGWVDVPKPGGWRLVLDEQFETHHQLYQKPVEFELGPDVNKATLGVHVENGSHVSKIDFILSGDEGFIETYEFHFSKDGFLVPPLDLKASLREEFKKKVGSLTADFFMLGGSLGIMGNLHLLNATRNLRTLVLQNPQPWWDHTLID